MPVTDQQRPYLVSNADARVHDFVRVSSYDNHKIITNFSALQIGVRVPDSVPTAPLLFGALTATNMVQTTTQLSTSMYNRGHFYFLDVLRACPGRILSIEPLVATAIRGITRCWWCTAGCVWCYISNILRYCCAASLQIGGEMAGRARGMIAQDISELLC